MTARDAVARTAKELEEAGIGEARVDAELLVAHVLGVRRSQLWTTRAVVPDDVLRPLVARRRSREPLPYVLGEWGFRQLVLQVDSRVLVPRPETEVVVERCLALVRRAPRPAVLDAGTGSGAIALAVASEHPGARVTGIDLSPGALALARENAARLGLDVRLERWDLAAGLPAGPWDLVVSNPPYVSAGELAALAPEVRDWEPRDAIVDRGQTDAVVTGARDVLRPGGWLVLETHWDRAAHVAATVAVAGYGPPTITRDLAGRDRVVEAPWTG